MAAIAQAVLASGIAPAPAAAAGDAASAATPRVILIGTTLLPGSGVELRNLPANAQVFSGSELRRQSSGSLTDFLADNATGLSFNAAQGNPHQPDINLRGFSASPLIGTPQGISVFLDGVRVNEPFGDSVNWDLIPSSAIASIELIPGSNPAFGLNTLGGAIAVYTKSGGSAYPNGPGGSVTLSGGSFGRRELGFEAGGVAGDWDWYVAGRHGGDDGWAEHNRSELRQLFAKLRWLADATGLTLSLQLADNVLEGTQTLPPGFSDIRQAYTWPDINANRVAALALGDFVPQTDAESATGYLGVFVSDSIGLDERWTLSLAGRFNRADVTITDRSGSAPGLNGSHRFRRFNPAIGLSFHPGTASTFYASYNEGMRAPTAVELTCADPDAPCRLPNSFLSETRR